MLKESVNQLLTLRKVFDLKIEKKIIPRNDHWNIKAEEVNNHMKEMCASAKIDYIDNFQNFNPRRHLNNSRLHLNDKGSYKLNNIFVSYLSDLFK